MQTGTCVYTASQARLGGPILTPRCFPKKTSCRGPSLRYTTLKTIHTASFPLSCCVPCLHTYHNIAESRYGTFWHTHCMVFVCNLKAIFSSAHMDSEILLYLSKYSLFLILALLTAGEFGFTVCVIWSRELEKFVF